MAGPARIFSTHPLHPDIAAQLADLGELLVASSPDAETLCAECGDAEFIVVRAPIPPQLAKETSRLRAMIRHGAGLDMIPVEDCTEAGIMVANVPGANARTVAEHTMWTAMALLRKYPQVDRDLRAKSWQDGRRHSDDGREISGRTIGIVGMGNIGRAIASMAMHGFGMTVLTHTRSPEKAPPDITTCSLNHLLETSDIVVLCCPLTQETRGLIDARAFARMDAGAILVNVSRGAVVVERDLVDALQSGRLAGAALDVFAEQPLPLNHPLLSIPNAILTPHMAGITTESMRRMGQGVVDEVTRIASGRQPANFVNPQCLAKYRERFGNS